MGFAEMVTAQAGKLDHKPAEPKRQGFYPVETISLAEGWQQIISGTWRGIGLLDVQEPLHYEWGRQILITEPGRDREKLQAQYPRTMMFEPEEFMDAVNNWPENAGVVLAKRIFNGDIMEVINR